MATTKSKKITCKNPRDEAALKKYGSFVHGEPDAFAGAELYYGDQLVTPENAAELFGIKKGSSTTKKKPTKKTAKKTAKKTTKK